MSNSTFHESHPDALRQVCALSCDHGGNYAVRVALPERDGIDEAFHVVA